MNRPEEDLQRACVEWLDWMEPRWRGRMTYFAVPNQRGTRSRAEAGVLEAMGVRPGVSDFVFLMAGGRAFCVELKAPGKEGALSKRQAEWLETCSRLQVPVYVISSQEELEKILERYELLAPVKGRKKSQAGLFG